MASWGWAFVSLGAMMLMLNNWQFGLLSLIVGALMIWRGKKGTLDGDRKDDQSND